MSSAPYNAYPGTPRSSSMRPAGRLGQTGRPLHRIALVDPFADVNLDEIWTLVADPDVETLVHAGAQDLEPVARPEPGGQPLEGLELLPHALRRRLDESAPPHVERSDLETDGTQKSMLDLMQTREELYALLDYDEFEERDREYFGNNVN